MQRYSDAQSAILVYARNSTKLPLCRKIRAYVRNMVNSGWLEISADITEAAAQRLEQYNGAESAGSLKGEK